MNEVVLFQSFSYQRKNLISKRQTASWTQDSTNWVFELEKIAKIYL